MPVTGDGFALRAVFRDGQTFLTWRELPTPPEGSVRYRLYRSTTRFTAPADLTAGHLLVEVGQHTGLHLVASIDRLALSQTPADATYAPPRRVTFTIDESAGPLPEHVGLFVHTARAVQTAYYAITAVFDGSEQRIVAPGDSALANGIDERVEPPQPVRQNDEIDYVHWTDHAGTLHYPAMSSLPSVPYTFRVRPPATTRPSARAPVIGLLHGALHQYNTPDSARGEKLDAPDRMHALRIALDSPLLRGRIHGLEDAASLMPPGGWYGYNDCFGTGQPLEQGSIQPYHVNRVLWTLDWVTRAHGGDPDCVTLAGGSMGGAGVLVIGLLHPERFAALHAHIPLLTRDGPRWRRRPEGSSGPGGGQDGGQGPRLMEVLPFEPATFLAAHPERDYPFIMCTAGRTDHIVGWPDKLALARAAADVRAGFVLYWDVRGHGGSPDFPATWGRLDTGGRETHRLTSFSRRQSFPALTDVTADGDPGAIDLAVHPSERPPLDTPGVGDLVGTLNGSVDWDRATIEDTPERYAITLRLLPTTRTDRATAMVTPRRLQAFHPAPAETVQCRVTTVNSQETLLDVTVRADEFGRVSVPRVPLTHDGTRLQLTRA